MSQANRTTTAPAARPPEHAFLGWLEAAAAAFPDKVFVHSIDQEKAISYGAALDLVGRIARVLAARGIGANDRVALLSNNSLEHLMAYLGTMVRGATICTVHVEMNAVYFEEILTALAPRLVLYESGLGLERLAGRIPGEWQPLGTWERESGGEGFYAEAADARPGPPETPVNGWEDVASIFYTSGTESKPKGVVCCFAELIENTQATTEAFAITAADRLLDFRSYNWMSAQTLSFLGALCAGASLYMARKFSQSRYFDWVRRFDATIAAGNPTVINMLINRPVGVAAAEVPTLRFVTSSSAPLMVADWKRFEEMYGVPIAQGYGSSETGWIAGSNERTRRLGSVGRPLPYQHLAIVDEAGRALPAGEIGAIELGRHPACEYRYLADDGSIRVNARGRTRTGDLGYIDTDGYLYVTGRSKDLIIRGGVNIAPLEIDNLVLQMPEVAEAAAVGVPDPIYGEEVVVYVAPRTGVQLAADAVLAHCGTSLPHAKMPKEVLFRASLPKTERGKMDRKALAADWMASHAGAG